MNYQEIIVKFTEYMHISQIANRFIRHPSDLLSVGDAVTTWVISIDETKKRISLTLKKPTQ